MLTDLTKKHHFERTIGIDPGTQTGIAVATDKGDLVAVNTMKLHEAIMMVHALRSDSFIRIEDARLRKNFGKTGRERLQGAGSIKRDCKIWEEYLSDYKIPHEFVHPKNIITKLDSTKFRLITGWPTITDQHGRDAAMLVHKYKYKDAIHQH